jgi:acetylornithine aminotransferase
VNCLGHAHPFVVSAVTSQLATLGHVSNFFGSAPQIALAEKLLSLFDTDGKVFFTNSGTEANEAAFKITRKTGRTKIVSTVGAFHGRTMGALAITWKPAYREQFAPLPGDVTFVPYGDVAALAAAVDDETAAVVLEPIQGENGVVVPPDGYLQAARQITSEHGALLWIDEIQTGVGRTGDWFAFQAEGIKPDIVTLAKGLGAGIPIGACIGFGAAAELLQPGNHGTTFGGNPVASIAGLAVLTVIERDGLLANVNAVGNHLASSIVALDHPLIAGVRGRGLLLAIELTAPVSDQITALALEAGFIVNNPIPDAIRLAPPYILSKADADSFVAALAELLDQVEGV